MAHSREMAAEAAGQAVLEDVVLGARKDASEALEVRAGLVLMIIINTLLLLPIYYILLYIIYDDLLYTTVFTMMIYILW